MVERHLAVGGAVTFWSLADWSDRPRLEAALAHLGLAAFVVYALRLPEEFAVLALRDALAVSPRLVALPAVQQWIARARAKGLFLAA